MCRKSFGMQLPREILDGGNDSRRGSVDRIADDSEAAVADSIKTAPSGTLCEHVEIIMSAIGMRRRENEKVRLQADHFLKTHVGPVLRRVHDGGRAREPQCISDKSALAHRDQRI